MNGTEDIWDRVGSLLNTDDPAVAYFAVWGLLTVVVGLYIYWMWCVRVKP